ncbi:MAG: hypothetical protein CfP315_0828 [Candidatus Improbicoccus pseudotrichonymphae]|uniref:Uncharacterized protein n=1 Tax=Candidatus Improbicoccus pseudotrichonymphae TaxID=3033792 RepID=A0AA48IB34_9FIRM|nr:MAG: hypothetical protein CfP315_0828 [Candidatus Improbicoccus pseudotrichonymphae]
MEYKYATNFGCISDVISGTAESLELPGEGHCSINAYGGLYNTARIEINLPSEEDAQTVIQTLGYLPNLNTTYVGSGIKLDIEGDYQIDLTVMMTYDFEETTIFAFARQNGVQIPTVSITRETVNDTRGMSSISSIVHLNCGDVIDIGIRSRHGGLLLIPQNNASLVIKKLDTQICCDCIRKIKGECGHCNHCPRSSNEIKLYKGNC